jgi:predicted tellurium resistance membrane protein TerC
MQMIAQWLDSVGARAFGVSAAIFVLMNGAAIAVLAIKRDYALVNRWTSRLLAANLVLLGTGVGLPLVTTMARSALLALAPVTQGISTGESEDQRAEARQMNTAPIRP